MPDTGVDIRIRTRGAPQAAREVRNVSGALGHVGAAGRAGAAGLGAVDRASRRAGISLRQVGAIAAGWQVASALRAAAGAGIQFNKVQDAQRVGFTTMLGSGQAAADMMQRIQALALRSPILDPASTGDAARSLLAFGIPLKDVLGDVERLGDMSAATGRSISETMPLGARALGQIASKGKLSMEEMNQLAEGIGLGQTAIRKELGMTREEFAATFTPGNQISASKALPAIRRAMEKQSKGAAKLMSETTAGQFDAARERFARRMGQLTRPAFDQAGDIVGSLSKELDQIAGRKDISLDEKLTLSQQAIRRKLEPVVHELGDLWRRNHMGERLADGFEAAVPKLMNAAGKAAGAGAGAFVRAWWTAGPYGKIFAAALIASKLGVFTFLGRSAALRFGAGWGVGPPLPVTPGAAGGAAGKAGRLARIGRAVPGVAVAGLVGWEVGSALHDTGVGRGARGLIGNDPGSIQGRNRKKMRDRGLVPVQLSNGATVWEKPGDARRERARTRAPRARDASRDIHNYVVLDGRVVARSVNRVNDNERAHNRRPPK